MTYVLVLDTCTERGVMGIFKDGNPIISEKLPEGYQSSKHLLPAIEKGFKEIDVKPKDLAYIGVGIGPGSYTGIRLGAVVAKSFAFACGLPLIGICTLETFVPEADGPFAAIIDAKISGAYLLIGNKNGKAITYDTQPEVVPLSELSEKLHGINTLVTPKMHPLYEKIPEHHWSWTETSPNIERLAFLTHKKYQNQEYTPGTDLDLIYLRKTQAEIEKGM